MGKLTRPHLQIKWPSTERSLGDAGGARTAMRDGLREEKQRKPGHKMSLP